MMVRKPSLAPSCRARRPASASRRPSARSWRTSTSYSVATCSRGMISRCTGACGRTSWNATTWSSSCTFFAGISPRTILQKMQLASVLMSPLPLLFSPGRLFVEAGHALAPPHLLQRLLRAQAVARQHHQAVEPQVGDLAHEMGLVAALRREHHLGGLLADLLQHAVVTLREQLRGVGLLRIAALAGLDGVGDALQDVFHFFL